MRIPWWPLAVAAVTFVVFLPTLGYEFLNWDDGGFIVHNERIRSFSWTNIVWMFTTAHNGPYQPIPWLTWALDYQLWGLSSAGFHLGNNLFHALNAALAFVAVRWVFLRMGMEKGTWLEIAAASAALFFAIHPLRVESVAWASERRDVVAGTLALLCVLTYLKAVAQDRVDWRWLALSTALFFLSLLSKATTVPLPAVLLVMDVYPLERLETGMQRVRSGVRLILEKAPYGVVAVLASWIAVLGQQGAEAMVPFTVYSPVQRVAQAFFGFALYLNKTVLPTGLAPLYPVDPGISFKQPLIIACTVGVLALTGALIGFRRRVPGLVVATLCYLLLIAPLLGFLQIGSAIAADRYTYLATLPFAPVFGWAVYHLPARFPERRRVLVAVAAGILAALGLQTVFYMSNWRNSIELWAYTVKRQPGVTAWVNLGDALFDAREPAQAIEATTRALEIERNPEALRNRGIIYASLRRYDEATTDFDEALKLRPDYPQGLVDRGRTHHLSGRAEEAEADYTRAIEIYPCQVIALTNRGAIEMGRQEYDAALRDFTQAIECRPPNGGPYYNRARLYAATDRPDEAIADYTMVLRIEPDAVRARVERGKLYLAQGSPFQALEDLDAALDQVPNNPPLLMDRAEAYVAAGMNDAAARDLQWALNRTPPGTPLHGEISARLAALQSPE